MSYPNAPVVEAIIDVRLVFESEPDVDALASWAAEQKARFPLQNRIRTFQLTLGIVAPGDGPLEAAKALPEMPGSGEGIRITSAANDRVLHIRRGGFTFSHLPPYTQWEPFCGEALQLFAAFRERFRPVGFTRLATRFINRIHLPRYVDIAEYLKIRAAFPIEAGNEVSGYFVQLSTRRPEVDPRCMAIINTGLEQSAGEAMAVLLDIDCFFGGPPRDIDTELASGLAKLRTAKNVIFESAITDTTRDLFK